MTAATTILSSLMFIGVIITVLFLIILLYRLLYTKNMNKALDGEATKGLIDLGSLVKIVAISALLVMNIVTLTKINNLTSQLSNVENNLTNQISYLRSQISFLDSEMDSYYSSLELIQNRDYEFIAVDLENDIYSYNIEFTLLEKETGSDVYLIVENNGVSTRTILSSPSLTYTHTLDLEYSTEHYTISVLIEGEQTIQGELFNIYVDRTANSIINTGFSIIENIDQYTLVPFVLQNLYMVDDITVETVTIDIYENDVLKKSVTITTPTDIDTLTAPYEGDHYVVELPEEPIFATTYTPNDASDLRFEYTITLSSGKIVTRTGEF